MQTIFSLQCREVIDDGQAVGEILKRWTVLKMESQVIHFLQHTFGQVYLINSLVWLYQQEIGQCYSNVD